MARKIQLSIMHDYYEVLNGTQVLGFRIYQYHGWTKGWRYYTTVIYENYEAALEEVERMQQIYTINK